jgi:hypothetical protein|tara:strand:+ start:91 stop:324 length:234 start_codon:yes stop_codon:yes gene_type:complete
MPGFQERWIVGKTVESLSRHGDTWVGDSPDYTSHRRQVSFGWRIEFTDGSSAIICPNEDGHCYYTTVDYTPAKRRKW